MWGDVCFLEEDENAPLAVKRMCIKTVKSSLIHDKIRVVAQGIEYVVTVREISNWEPDMMEEGYIDSDIPDLSGDEEEDVCFDEDEIEGLKVKDGEKVDEGHGDSFSTENMHSKGDRGVGFVDRKGGFFQTNIKRKGNEVVDGGSSSFVAAAAPGTDVNQSEPVMHRDVSPDRLAEDVMPNGPTHAVDDVEGERISESLSQHPGFRRKKSSSSFGSSKLVKKKSQ
ncbi:unnamed protein product [Lactuca virosa]|uniref:Uncharacterized protein n=1 Tax=Lactuca virosa TaxID=75947 RepID=A0AAU9M5D4_9ASTR|nr:unnamed protein product [Lactuca virosa]